MKKKPRTIQTERALRLMFKQISNVCMEKGIDQKIVLDHLQKYRIQTTPNFVNEVWRVIMQGTVQKDTKADLEQKEVEVVYEEFTKFWSEVTGEHFTFPSYEALSFQALLDTDIHTHS